MVIARSHCKDPGSLSPIRTDRTKLRNRSIGAKWWVATLSRILLRAGLDAWPDLIKYLDVPGS